MFFQSGITRQLLINTYRCYTKLIRHYPEPKILVNSMPKAGTHLLASILAAGPKLMLSGHHIRQWQVNKFAQNAADNRLQQFEFNPNAFAQLLATIQPGQIATSHLPWNPQLMDMLVKSGFAMFFLIRDPRDILVSQLHYITGLRRHPLHNWLTNAFENNEQRLMALIRGHRTSSLYLPAIGERIQAYRGWIGSSACKLVRFEELVPTQNTNGVAQVPQWKPLFNHVSRPLSPEALENVRKKLKKKKSFTFRKGVTGEWRSHYNDEHKALFKCLTGDALITMGYESDTNW